MRPFPHRLFVLVAVGERRDKAAEERDSLACITLVTHYRYDGDRVVRTLGALRGRTPA